MTSYSSTMTSTGLTLSSGSSPEPARAKGLVATRAVETKGGWLGQLIVADQIIWETPIHQTAQSAEEAATKRAIAKLQKVFA